MPLTELALSFAVDPITGMGCWVRIWGWAQYSQLLIGHDFQLLGIAAQHCERVWAQLTKSDEMFKGVQVKLLCVPGAQSSSVRFEIQAAGHP